MKPRQARNIHRHVGRLDKVMLNKEKRLEPTQRTRELYRTTERVREDERTNERVNDSLTIL